jgi:hypothetical protein
MADSDDNKDEKIDATRRRLMRIAVYTPPVILGVISLSAGCQPVSCFPVSCPPNTQCGPNTCNPVINPCAPQNCNPLSCNPNT